MPSETRTNNIFPSLGLSVITAVLLGGCAGQTTVDFSAGHVTEADRAAVVQPPARKPQSKPEPVKKPPLQTYTVAVKEVPVVDLLFSLARDAGLDIDLQADSRKTVTLNAIERPLDEILMRVAEQAALRFKLRGRNLIVEDDAPYWKNYLVDYVNVARDSQGEVGVATQIATSGGTVGEDIASTGDGQGNLSKTTVKNVSRNDFWASLEMGLEAVVSESKVAGVAETAESYDPIIINQMSGVVTAYGTQAQHNRVQAHLDSVMSNSKRQVLIEMTIVEVELSDKYQAGVDWQRLSSNGGLGSDGVSFSNNMLGANLSTPPFFSLGYNDLQSDGSSITATVSLLQQFGDTKVLSSPKIMALNNQTALLKVVNENVFFTVELDVREATADIPERRTFTSQLHTVPVGLVLSVTPQISENGSVSMNIRPTISRITGFAIDPAPRLAGADFDNLIPEIQVREIESLLQVQNGRTIVLGGLMQNEQESQRDGIPGLSKIPKLGKLFSYSRDELVKTELVIFLKPTIVDANGNYGTGSELSDYYNVAAEMQPTADIEYR
ncbi:MAG: pilus (MSHA type) biogenesis protein MshL [Gammaproteobacteria bacterium]|nr:pilus (MSHA type) biogenesis protein MshL [Gammaproteobacteria bacterium]